MSTSSPTIESFALKGMTVILTGGAGIFGRGLATQLAEAGATLIIASRSTEALGQVVAEERAKGFDVTAEALDQGDETSIMRLRDRVLERFGRIDGLVNNAVARPMKTLGDPVSAWNESMRVNATGIFVLTRCVAEVMATKARGSIVNISSIFGMMGPNLANYEGTEYKVPPDYFFHKGGMINLTRYFASMYGSSGVRSNCVSPGGYYTGQDPAFVTRYCKGTMLGRMAGDRDLGGAVTFLLSPASAYITGVNLPVDGGYTAK